MDYRGARFYDADVGRFLSLDPLAAKYPSLSDYCYVAGNPLVFVDSDGRENTLFIYAKGMSRKEMKKLIIEVNNLAHEAGLNIQAISTSKIKNSSDLDDSDSFVHIGSEFTIKNDTKMLEEYGYAFSGDVFKNFNSSVLDVSGRPDLGDSDKIILIPEGNIKAVSDRSHNSNFKGWTEKQIMAWAILHGAGHNAELPHTKGTMMESNPEEGKSVKTSKENRTKSGGLLFLNEIQKALFGEKYHPKKKPKDNSNNENAQKTD